MATFKILVNSTLSTRGARWLGLDVKIYYLGTPMDHNEYMFIPLNLIPPEIIDFYIFTKLPTKAKSMLKYAVACMAFHNLAYLPKISSTVSWATMVTPPYDTLWAFGTTNGAQSASALLSMTSASNTLAMSMLTI